MVRKAARKNHLLINTFLILAWFIGFDEDKYRHVTGMVKNIFEYYQQAIKSSLSYSYKTWQVLQKKVRR
jgi:hypothetical protein